MVEALKEKIVRCPFREIWGQFAEGLVFAAGGFADFRVLGLRQWNPATATLCMAPGRMEQHDGCQWGLA